MTGYVGLDVSREETGFCVMDNSGNVLSSGKTPSDPDALFEMVKRPGSSAS
jgi:predicted NBD/HSP70 family sugar kinase